jgi:hypothetical protein
MMIRRASTELISNLIYHPIVFSKFLAEDSQLLQIMIALSDDDDFNTRRAASGCLAVLSSEPDSISLILAHKRIEEIIESLLESENEELVARVSEILKNISSAGKLSSRLLSFVSKLG